MEKEQEPKGFKREHKIVIGLLIVNILISLIILNMVYSSGGSAPTPSAPQEQQPEPQILKQVSLDDDPLIGNKDAKITIVEFSDFQCPFCRRFWSATLPQLKKDYIDAGKANLVYRDFPLGFHPGAQPAAEASECADDQGKFWEMHDKIFGEQDKQGQGTAQFGKEELKTWAKSVSGLDYSKWESCFDSGKHTEEVKKDEADGNKYQVSGTPTFFIGNSKSGYVRLVGAQPLEAFRQILDQMK